MNKEIMYQWFIKNGNTVIRWFTISILSVAFIFLLIMSIIKKDLQYPRKHPIIFTLETILISLTMGVINFVEIFDDQYYNDQKFEKGYGL